MMPILCDIIAMTLNVCPFLLWRYGLFHYFVRLRKPIGRNIYSHAARVENRRHYSSLVMLYCFTYQNVLKYGTSNNDLKRNISFYAPRHAYLLIFNIAYFSHYNHAISLSFRVAADRPKRHI